MPSIAETSFQETLTPANQGYSGAQYNLGIMYEDGDDMPQDKKKLRNILVKLVTTDNGSQKGCDKYRILNIGY